MKFGAHLSESIQPEWSFNYISYDELKNVLKTRTDTQHWTETDEGYFVELLERELEKVHSFQNVKIGEVQRKLSYYNTQAQEFKRNGAEEETWRALEIELYRLIAEIDVLAKYTRLNYTGFLKIVKKHDVSFFSSDKEGVIICFHFTPHFTLATSPHTHTHTHTPKCFGLILTSSFLCRGMGYL
ncbi:MAG: hypothetical protein BYD32DRAFT_413446 [Podila humilis]|nr:MAG: hypothetical protein BYD32DRAFT_413446 [Podila humilis]